METTGDQIEDCSAWLAEGDGQDELAIIRKNIEKGLACGSNQFISKLGKVVGRSSQFWPQGRPRRGEK